MGGAIKKSGFAGGLCLAAISSAAWSADFPIKAIPTPAEAIAARWNAAFASEVRYFTWTGDRGSPTGSAATRGKGSQVYVPFAAQFAGRPTDDFKVEFLARGGWVWARQSTSGLAGEFSGSTDTAVSGTVTYYGFNGIQPFFSLLTNLPTGTSVLGPSEANARMDPDLVEISSFGEGLNIGPTGGFTLALAETFTLTASVGYTWRDSYFRDKSLASTAIGASTRTFVDPGEVLTATVSMSSQVGQLSSVITGSYSHETVTAENGMSLYRAGDRYLISGTFNYNWDSFGVTTLTASATHSRKNDILFLGAGALTTEPVNTNSNLIKVGLQHLFPVGSLWVGPMGSFLYRDRNGYEPNTLQFVPAKERWTAGAIARYAANNNLTLNARVEHVWTKEDENLANLQGLDFSVLANALVPSSSVPVVSMRGWQAAAGFNLTF